MRYADFEFRRKRLRCQGFFTYPPYSDTVSGDSDDGCPSERARSQ
jgi:hypothetical protein